MVLLISWSLYAVGQQAISSTNADQYTVFSLSEAPCGIPLIKIDAPYK